MADSRLESVQAGAESLSVWLAPLGWRCHVKTYHAMALHGGSGIQLSHGLCTGLRAVECDG